MKRASVSSNAKSANNKRQKTSLDDARADALAKQRERIDAFRRQKKSAEGAGQVPPPLPRDPAKHAVRAKSPVRTKKPRSRVSAPPAPKSLSPLDEARAENLAKVHQRQKDRKRRLSTPISLDAESLTSALDEEEQKMASTSQVNNRRSRSRSRSRPRSSTTKKSTLVPPTTSSSTASGTSSFSAAVNMAKLALCVGIIAFIFQMAISQISTAADSAQTGATDLNKRVENLVRAKKKADDLMEGLHNDDLEKKCKEAFDMYEQQQQELELVKVHMETERQFDAEEMIWEHLFDL